MLQRKNRGASNAYQKAMHSMPQAEPLHFDAFLTKRDCRNFLEPGFYASMSRGASCPADVPGSEGLDQ